jgi:outer membrane protein
MKNGVIIWNVVLSLLCGYLLFNYVNSKKNSGGIVKTPAIDSAANKKEFRVAYFEMDSVAANFYLAKEFKSDVMSKEETINATLDKLSKNLQNRLNYYQNLAKSGTMTQETQEAASLEMKNLDDELKNKKQVLDQEYNDFVMRRQNDIKTKIKNYIKDYNLTKTYSFIVSDDPGLFYYQDTAYNITSDVVKGLNEFYKKKK